MQRKLSRKQPSRNHLLRNLAISVILYEKVDTTKAKASSVKPIVDRWISMAKNNTLAARRELLKDAFDAKAVDKMFDILIKRYENRTSGFARTFKLGNRLGDGAPMVRIELINNDQPEIDDKPKRTKKAVVDTQTPKTTEEIK